MVQRTARPEAAIWRSEGAASSALSLTSSSCVSSNHLSQKAHDLISSLAVESGSRFIQEEQLRGSPIDQSPVKLQGDPVIELTDAGSAASSTPIVTLFLSSTLSPSTPEVPIMASAIGSSSSSSMMLSANSRRCSLVRSFSCLKTAENCKHSLTVDRGSWISACIAKPVRLEKDPSRGRPSTSIEPSTLPVVLRPEMVSNKVVLPAPEAPIRAVRTPGRISPEIPFCGACDRC